MRMPVDSDVSHFMYIILLFNFQIVNLFYEQQVLKQSTGTFNASFILFSKIYPIYHEIIVRVPLMCRMHYHIYTYYLRPT